MKTLAKILKNYKTWSVIITAAGSAITGVGLYDLAKNNIKEADLKIKFGAIILTSAAAYYLTEKSEKSADEKNYQTKPEDYQNKN